MKRFFFSESERVTQVKEKSFSLGLLSKYGVEIVYKADEADLVVVGSEEQYLALIHGQNEFRVFILVIDEGQMVSVKSKTLVVSCFNCAAQAVITFAKAQ